MQLKRLEIHGFKSFADKTVLEFGSGITAIVGPNGCGKTNILDAIRWVLGEQSSRLLRCDQMDNVVFNGCDSRRPLGRAMVSMTLVNNKGVLPIEYDEITIMRELFRSGESNYYLNKASCRLKDITDLFMDTGLGSHVYSIIEQSQIDLILSNKPALRRLLFEEAAGISKFKNRKELALRKLEGTNQNLERLSDIVSEVGRQRESLKRQASKASQYQTLKDELLRLECFLVQRDLAQVEAKQQNCQKLLTTLEQDNTSQNATLVEFESRLETARLQLLEQETLLKNAAATLADHILQYEKITSAINLKKEKITTLKQQFATWEAEISQRQTRLVSLGERMNQEELALSDAKAEMALKSESLKELEARLAALKTNLAAAENDLSAAEKLLNENKNQKNNVINKIAALKTQQTFLLQGNQKLAALINQKNERKTEILAQLAGKEKELQETLAAQDKRKVTLGGAKTKRTEVEKNLDGLRLERSQIENIYSENQSLKKALEELHRKRHGFFAGVKAALQLKENKTQEWTSGIIGVIADLVRADERYRLALETAAGSNIQNIVTQTADVAEAVIEHLKRERLGRATFLALDIISPQETDADPKIMKEAGVIGLAIDLINIAPEYQSLVKLIWGKTLVVDTLATAIRLTRRYRTQLKLVTLEGELVKGGGAITGGYQGGEEAGLLMRETRIDSLQATNQELAAQIDALKSREQEQITIRDNLHQEILTLEKQLHEQELLINNQRHAANVLDAESKRLLEEGETASTEKSRQEEAQAQLVTDLTNLEQEQTSWTAKIDQQTTALGALQKTTQELRAASEAQTAQGTILKVSLAAFFEREKNLERQKIEQQNLEKSLQEEISARQIAKVNAQGEQETLSAAIQLEEETLRALGLRLKKQEAENGQWESGRQDLLVLVSELETKLKENRSLLQQFQQTVNEVNLEKARLEMETKALQEKMANYQYLNIDTAAIEIAPESAPQKIEQLREKIIRLEPVNLAALEEFQEIDQRYQFLTTQIKDLDDAKQSLNATINQLNRTSEAQFQETFAKIQTNFEVLFRRFFGGGKTALLLTDEANVLESGIEIIAQPRGKRPQSITQLSAGERALTAIALVFAIFMVKPSPFCILDEVDAPLDENNIRQYTDLVKEFATKSQFLTITHNKRTMEAARTIYGVTMEELGISKLISVRLQDEQQQTLNLLETGVS